MLYRWNVTICDEITVVILLYIYICKKKNNIENVKISKVHTTQVNQLKIEANIFKYGRLVW